MKVLMINTVPTEKNGITGVIFNIINHINSDKISIDYLSINKPDNHYTKTVNEHGGKMYVIPRSIKKPFSYVRNLYKLLKKNRYDIIHVHGNSSTLTLEMLAAKLANCKVRIAHSHNTTCKYKFVHYVLTPLFRLLCNERMACGIDAGKWLFGNQRFTVINNGIDVNKFFFDNESRNYIRKKYDISDEKIIIGHVGVFNTQKNHKYLVDAFKKAHEKQPNLILMLVGEGELFEQVKEQVKIEDISNDVIFCGVTNDVNKYYAAMDAIFMPSLYEGLPLTLIEAQANGLPCYISDVITKEVDKTGLIRFIPLDDINDWVKEMSSFSKKDNRCAESKKSIKNIISEGYSIEHEAEKLIRLYKK